MAHPSLVNIGAYIHAALLALSVRAQDAGPVEGNVLPVEDFRSGVLVAFTGEVAGAPATTAVTYKLQSRTDADGTWTDVRNPDGDTYTAALTGADQVKELDVNFLHLGDEHAELRVVGEVAFTGGATPTVVAGALLVRGGSSRRPV